MSLHGKAKAIYDRLVREWSIFLRLPKTRRLKFECDDEETNYITQPRDAIPIGRSISEAIIYPATTCRVFIDAFACVGGDTLAAMDRFDSADVYAIQINTGRYAQRFQRLQKNVEEFNQVVPGRFSRRAYAIGTDIRSFLKEKAPSILSNTDNENCSILYLDPPWGVDPANAAITSPLDDLDRFLTINVWIPMQESLVDVVCLPLLIVLKLPLEADDIRHWPVLRENYQIATRLCIRQKFYVHIFKKQTPN